MGGTSVEDVDVDALAHCASYLSLRDISNMAMSSKHLKATAYSDSLWLSLYRHKWPHDVLAPLSSSSIREAYWFRHISLHQFKYVDPLLYDIDISTVGKPPHQIIFHKNTILFSQGPLIQSCRAEKLIHGTNVVSTHGNHNARITCMRLFSPAEQYPCRSESERDDGILITSSSDHTIRLWSNGGNRCFKGHFGPVCTLSDKPLGDGVGKVFASGGEDSTVRLWSINSAGKRGQRALKATLRGHEKAVSLMSVAGHKTSLLVSVSKNKVRVWDTNTASSSTRSSCCVGTTTVPVAPVGMKCHESLLYVAAGSSVITFDLRTMHKVSNIVQQDSIRSFEVLPSKSIFCTGGNGRAMLWDIRKVSDTLRVEPTVELDGHVGPVKLLHMDSHKIVTAGPYDQYVKVWEADSGEQTNSLICADPDQLLSSGFGCSAMAVDGCRIVTASGDGGENSAVLRFRDFSNASCAVSLNISEEGSSSKFWGTHSDCDSEDLGS